MTLTRLDQWAAGLAALLVPAVAMLATMIR